MHSELVKLLLDETTMKVLQAAVFEKLYPTQIAAKLGKSKGYVTKKLNALEKHEVIKGRFWMKSGSVVKKFELLDEEISLKINLIHGTVDLEKKKIEEEKSRPSERVQELFR